MKKHGKLFVYIILAFFATSCASDKPSSTALNAEYKIPKYDGTRDGFIEFSKRYKLESWPIPVVLNYFDNNRIRYAHWKPEGETLGTVVHFNGRTEFIERNIYTYKDLVNSGYEVWSLDWWGQGLSGRNLNNKQKHDIDTFDKYLIDANYFIDRVIRLNEKKGKKVLLAHSMGGQIALRYLLQDNKVPFDYAVLSSPLLKIPGDSFWLRVGNEIKQFFAGDSCVLSKTSTWENEFDKRSSCDLIGASHIDETELLDADETKKYSNDFKKMAEINCLIESSINANGAEKPDLRLACPTSNWLNAAFDSTDITMKSAKKLNTPTIIIRADPDNAVDPAGQDEFCELSNNCSILSVPTENNILPGHELLIEIEPIREFFFSQFNKHVEQ